MTFERQNGHFRKGVSVYLVKMNIFAASLILQTSHFLYCMSSAFGCIRKACATQVRQLCETTDWVDSGENVLLFGASDLGKNHLAAAIVDGVVSQGYRGRFYSAGELLQEIRKARSLLRLNEMLLKLDRYRVIVIDDLGYVKRQPR